MLRRPTARGLYFSVGFAGSPGPAGPGVAEPRAAGAILPVGAVFLRDWRRWTGWRVPLAPPGVAVVVVVGRDASGVAVLGCLVVDDEAEDAAPLLGGALGGMVDCF